MAKQKESTEAADRAAAILTDRLGFPVAPHVVDDKYTTHGAPKDRRKRYVAVCFTGNVGQKVYETGHHGFDMAVWRDTCMQDYVVKLLVAFGEKAFVKGLAANEAE